MAARIEATAFQASKTAIRSVRNDVFIIEQGNQAIGTGRLLADGRFGRMAVLRAWRNQSVGFAILSRLIALARQAELKSVYLPAQTSVCAFYQKAGVTCEGPIYREAGIPHQKMSLKFAALE